MKYTQLNKLLRLASLTIVFGAFTSPIFGNPEKVKDKDDTGITLESYEQKIIQGWTVRIEKSAKDHPKYSDVILDIENQLKDIIKQINPEIVKQLQLVPIWINKDVRSGACYHPDEDWLQKNNRLPEKVRSVEIQSIDSFLLSAKSQPMVMLHEMSHAFHHRIHDFKIPIITKAYEKAVAGKSYEKVKHINGRIVRHYALTNEKEYFAEATEAYFGKNDFFPANREELKKHDPDAYAMVESVWKVNPDKAK